MSESLSDAELNDFERKFTLCWCKDCKRALEIIQATAEVRREKILSGRVYELESALRAITNGKHPLL